MAKFVSNGGHLKIQNGGHADISAIINIVFQIRYYTSCYNLSKNVREGCYSTMILNERKNSEPDLNLKML